MMVDNFAATTTAMDSSAGIIDRLISRSMIDVVVRFNDIVGISGNQNDEKNI